MTETEKILSLLKNPDPRNIHLGLTLYENISNDIRQSVNEKFFDPLKKVIDWYNPIMLYDFEFEYDDKEIEYCIKFYNLKKIDTFYSTQLEAKKFPEELSILDNLWSITFDSFIIPEIPEHFKNIPNLRDLNINNCRFNYADKNIFNIPKLTNLDLSNNPIQILPTTIKNATNLISLSLYYTELFELPKEIEDLQNLVNFYIHSPYLTYIKCNFSKLEQLKVLYLSGPIKETHELIDSIKNIDLIALTLKGMDLSTINFDSNIFKRICYVNIVNCNLEKVPEFLNNNNIMEIELQHNNIEELPIWIFKLKNLRELKFHRNPNSHKVWFEEYFKKHNIKITHTSETSITIDVNNNKIKVRYK